LKFILTILAAGAASLLGGCVSGGGGSRSESTTTVSGFNQQSNTLGTQRRMDVYGGATAPVLPTMGAVGFGK
jgi:hypothetical protein